MPWSGYREPTKKQIQEQSLVYAVDSQSGDAYAITISGVTTYVAGMLLSFKANTANVGAATLNVNSLGAITIKKNHDQDLADNDIEVGQIVEVVYDGTNFQMESQVANTSSASGDSTTKTVNQGTHGLAVKDLVRYNGSAYVKAKADSAANAEVIGIVSAVADTDNFTLLTEGYISGLTGLTAGTVYFLDPSTAGALTATEPTTINQVSKPVLLAVSTTAGFFFNMRGSIVSSSIVGTTVTPISFRYNGELIVISNIDSGFVAPCNLTISKVYLYVCTTGTSGTTTADVNKNGTTIFTTQGNRPSVAYDNATGVTASVTPDVTAFSAGDRLTADIDAIAANSADASIVVVATADTAFDSGNTFNVGDGTDTDKKVTAFNGDANVPYLLYDASDNAWKFSNNGTTDFSMGDARIDGSTNYAADGGASDTYAITLSPVPGSYTTGMVVNFKANTANTGAATLNVNSLGAKTIKKNHDQDLADNDIEVGQVVTVIYDGTNFQMQSQVANAATASGNVVKLTGQSIDGGVAANDPTYYDTGSSTWKKATSTTPVPSGIYAGVAGEIVLLGYVSGLSGLVAGKDYYLADAGGITHLTRGFSFVQIGYSTSTSALIVAICPISKTTGKRYYWGLVGGGYAGPSNVIDYLNTTIISGNAADKGDLSVARGFIGCVFNPLYAFYTGGATSYPTGLNTIDYVNNSTATENATDTGDLSVARLGTGGVNGTVYGFIGGGQTGSDSDVIDQINTSTVSQNATDVGNLSVARDGPAGITGVIYGFYCGGGAYSNAIDYIDLTSATQNAVSRGTMAISGRLRGAVSNSMLGILAGGYTGSPSSAIDYISITTLTGNSVSRGTLTAARYGLCGVMSDLYGQFCGGDTGSASNVIDWIDFTTLANNALDRGDLTAARQGVAGSCS